MEAVVMKAWEGTFEIPIPERSGKPRNEGYTMIIDKGLGIERTKDLIGLAGDYIDNIKYTFGTSAFYDKELLIEKNEIITSSGIDIMPGGTFLEVAVWQGVLEDYLKRAKVLKFNTIEVSDGTIEMDLKTREDIIKMSLDIGFRVISEIGKKDPNEKIPISQMCEQVVRDIENGAFKVIIEARETGKGIGIYNDNGKIKSDELESICKNIDDVNNLIWEAPIKSQMQSLILRFGTNVNLGNIPPDEILALEALRRGLRGDTFKRAYLENKEWES